MGQGLDLQSENLLSHARGGITRHALSPLQKIAILQPQLCTEYTVARDRLKYALCKPVDCSAWSGIRSDQTSDQAFGRRFCLTCHSEAIPECGGTRLEICSIFLPPGEASDADWTSLILFRVDQDSPHHCPDQDQPAILLTADPQTRDVSIALDDYPVRSLKSDTCPSSLHFADIAYPYQ